MLDGVRVKVSERLNNPKNDMFKIIRSRRAKNALGVVGCSLCCYAKNFVKNVIS